MAVHVMPEPQGWGGHPQFPVDDLSDYDHRTEIRAPKQAKNKNGKDKNALFETRLEGFYLEKAEPRVGENSSWARVGRRAMPFADSKLAEISRKHRALTNVGPAKAFAALSSSQQGVVDRLITEYQNGEKDKDAEWVLEYVKPTIEKDYWNRVKRCTKIAVIIRRQERGGAGKNSQGSAKGTGTYAATEIIDLADPLPKKKDGKDKKGGKKNQNQQGNNDFDDVIGGPPMMDPFAELGRDHNIVDVPPNGPHHGGPHAGHHGNQQNPPMPPFGPPPGAIPAGAPFPPPHFPMHDQHPHPQHGANPFEPHPHFNTPDLYEEHRGYPPELGRNGRIQARTPVHMDDDRRQSRSRNRSASRLREQEYRRQQRAEQEAEEQREEDRRRFDEARRQQRVDQRRIETKMDELGAKLEDLEIQNKVDAWHNRDSSSEESWRDRRERDALWGEEDTRASFTPPSSPGRTEIYPSGSLGRRGSKDYRDVRGYPQDRRRSAGYRDGQAFIQPFNSTSHRDRSHRRNRSDFIPRAPSPGRYMRRPPLIHAATFDDYPTMAPAQRLLPQFEGQDYARAQFGRDKERRRRDSGYERLTRRNTVDYGRPRREEDVYVERGGRRRDPVWQ